MSKGLTLTVATWAAAMSLIAGSAHAQAASGERFVLSGVVFVDGARGLAWLQEPVFTNGRMVPVHVGDTVGPYRVTKILEDQVELEGPGGKVAVPLAGTSATASGASQTPQPSLAGLPPHPALKNPHAIVIPPGDPRQEFPASLMLLGAGAQLTSGKERPVRREASGRAGSRPADDRPVPASMQAPAHQLPPHPALNNPGAIVIPPGDPRQEFPTSVMLGH